MLSESELWIGDKVRLKKSGRLGKYSGKNTSGKHLVNLGHKSVVTSLSNILRVDDDDSYTSPQPQQSKRVFIDEETHYTSRELDLHIEKLKPSLLHANPIRIRDYQISRAQEFIDYAYVHNWSEIIIVHGRGNGVLRSEVHHIANISPHVYDYQLIHNDGATRLLLRR